MKKCIFRFWGMVMAWGNAPEDLFGKNLIIAVTFYIIQQYYGPNGPTASISYGKLCLNSI